MSYLISDWQQHLEAAGRSANTVRLWVGVLRRLHRDLPAGVAWASTTQIEAWLAGVRRTAPSPWSAVTYANAIRRFYAWADGRELDGDPAARMARPRHPGDRPRPVTAEQLRLAVERCTPWWRTAVLLGALAGLRASEMAGLYRVDITPDWIRIRRAKGGDPATVPTHPQLLALAAGHGHELMLPSRSGRPVGDLSSRAGEYFGRIGLPGVTLHRFRHYFACSLLRAGVDLVTVQHLMRHATIRSTQAYLLIVDQDRTDGIRRLPPLG